ncbi:MULTISPECIES: hypothetical protein [Stenotrophomonas]|uniref:hypothetical protein n=1 Tax=Stenotrophomonas TaxID=40323 RepID=UPI00128D8261|nr:MULTISPECIES: hypothetical protein [Stenotrophomonas]MBH1408397.1 hypothetical protein [Stenotrophomonas maltophilia]MBH1744994.1 hypothetical protein [Stenotrophomonas maltophilia]MBH1864897.1 hypothetical protein [Stenotrophomonas maltophilia]MDH1386799.1 hypothetical protein [Stenotrophomonas sp. GD03701]MDH1391293.1 hypothetical protein [Stenotrophomonas sp. GD03702]
MPTILGDFARASVKSLLTLPMIVPLAAVAATSPPQAWSSAAKASQLEALDYIEKLELARSAGPDAAADALGIKNGSLAEVATAFGTVRNFGGIELATELDQRSGQTTIVVRASGGCIDRDLAKAKLVLGKIVWAPLADSPAPVFGYAHFQGGSASTVFFDATGSRCLTGVRIEDPARLKGAIEAAYKQEASK